MSLEKVSLTDHERAVLRLLGEGFDRRTIAERLAINQHTIGQQVTRMYQKLGVKNRMQALWRGNELGLLGYAVERNAMSPTISENSSLHDS